MAKYIARFVLFIVPALLTPLLDGAHPAGEDSRKRHHPQFEAIRTLCLLSLVFGGLLWPLAWIWAYSKPVMHKLAYGTDKHVPDEEYPGRRMTPRQARAYESACTPRGERPHGGGFKDAPRRSRRARSKTRRRQPLNGNPAARHLLVLRLADFIKLKLLPWTTPWKVAVAIFPVVMIAILLLLLNIFAPTTSDVRVVKYIVPICSQVRGRVIEVPVETTDP